MLDFETLGNGKDKCVCQIGMVYFDTQTGELGKQYKANIDAATHIAKGAKIDAATVYWWLKQSQAARDSITEAPLRDVTEVFLEVNEFLKDAKYIWSHATFDFVTLTDTLKQLEIKPIFSYKAGLDIRTLVFLSGIQFDSHIREGTHHDALHDAIFQVKYCTDAISKLKANKILIKKLEGLA